MADQAEKLRALVKEREIPEPSHFSFTRAHTVAITSGKGGVGKSNVATNMSLALATLRQSVLILDADLGLANVDMLLGVKPRFNLQHVISGQKTLSEVVMEGPHGIKIIPGATGVQELADLDSEHRDLLLEKLSVLESQFDFLIMDTGAGLSRNVVGIASACDTVIVVTTPEPTAIMDAYSMIKVVHQTSSELALKLIINMARSEKEAQKTSESMIKVTRQFLNVSLDTLGYLPLDGSVRDAVQHWQPFFLRSPQSPASRQILRIAHALASPQEASPTSPSFFQKLAHFFR